MFVKQLSGISEGEADGSEELKAFRDTFATVRETYDEKDRSERLIHSAIKKMIESLDAHSDFMTPEQYQEMQVDAKGEFGGIGIKLAVQEGMLTVTRVLNGTPASKAGIREGDKIIKINNVVTNDMNLEDAIARLRGNPATSVRLAILRGQSQQAEDVTLVREIISIKSVASRLLGDGVGYVKINQFQKKTASELSGALSELQQKHVRALILDLRDNPGGLVFSAVDVAGHFIPSGKTVVYTNNRKGKKKEYRSRGNYPFSSVPLILLVNEKSASAAEIVAGALKDWERATLIGNRTYGKGSVQTLLPLKDGSAVKITTANYFTPKGNSIQTTGIVPDMLVTQGIKKDARMVLDARDDIQFQTALSLLKHGTVQGGRVPLAVKTAHMGHL
jgi:carboxyl-terminal processing protease